MTTYRILDSFQSCLEQIYGLQSCLVECVFHLILLTSSNLEIWGSSGTRVQTNKYRNALVCQTIGLGINKADGVPGRGGLETKLPRI
jgi:hypothetical protein